MHKDKCDDAQPEITGTPVLVSMKLNAMAAGIGPNADDDVAASPADEQPEAGAAASARVLGRTGEVGEIE
ncbi:hypothetical protein SAMN05421805_10290 [Saccharopolyspora antimicrobica]|uniref:Uncharacterized protein n=1 Tax=Saccharopolyspora antimicrobica TaxID=455193 RepID=A0A1I4VAK6_9PSEU|nr:hypothetical protein [Saccharopolyspora antimicrobica]RKT86197.1 hypothetical protein ATL45_4557 [Saccharopolyspora antimicrobica]SFM98203.1 hypothetical protein SAMN05421805_10290 [Saccharopolyspora antimicrobica]